MNNHVKNNFLKYKYIRYFLFLNYNIFYKNKYDKQKN